MLPPNWVKAQPHHSRITWGRGMEMMHTCFASSLRNTNGAVHLTFIYLTYAIDSGILKSLRSVRTFHLSLCIDVRPPSEFAPEAI